MTVAEFKMWLEGLSFSIKDAPTKAQWDLIKLKIEEIIPTISRRA